MNMAKKQRTVRLDERLADELAEFCRRGRLIQEGVIEAAIYWVVHQMRKDECVEVMERTTAYLDGEATADEPSVQAAPEPQTRVGRQAAKKLAGRRGKKDAAG